MGSSSKSSNQTTTKYQTQNISAPGASNVAGGNLTINALSKPAIELAGKSVDSAMAISKTALVESSNQAKTAMGIVADTASDALSSNVAVANNSLNKVADIVDLSYRQNTNQAQNLRDMTATAMSDIIKSKQSASDNNTALLIKSVAIIGASGLLVIIFTGKK